MKNLIGLALITFVIAGLTGCTGHVVNKEKNCTYDYLLVPAISISKMIGACGPADK